MVAAPGPCLARCHPPPVPGGQQRGQARPRGARRVLGRPRARRACEAPAPQRLHTGVWVCHSLVSKLISGSLTRGIKSRSRNGIHSSSCPGGERAPHRPPGPGPGQGSTQPGPGGGTTHLACTHPPPCNGTRAAQEGCSQDHLPRDVQNTRCHNVSPSQGTSATSTVAAGITDTA